MSSSELKFLVDVGVSRKVEKYLQDQGYDTKTVRVIDTRMSDEEIISLAASDGRMVHQETSIGGKRGDSKG